MLLIKIKSNKQQCPPATQNIKLNLENRQKAIDNYGYGPPNPDEPNDEFWQKKADKWNTDPEQAKTMRCGNCKVFNESKKMKNCIKKGMSGGEESEADNYHSAVESLGYCEMLHFKCAASRTCNAWISEEEY